MCELKVILDDKVIFEDTVYAKDDGNTVTLKSILGSEKKVEGCRIKEINIGKELLRLSQI